MSTHSLEAVSHAFFAAMNAGDMDALVGTLADDAVAHEPVGTPPHRGRVALRGFYEGLGAAFATMQIAVDTLVAVDRATAVKWTGRGTLHNGEDVTFEGIDVHEFDADGRIQTVNGYFDPAPMITALGVAGVAAPETSRQ